MASIKVARDHRSGHIDCGSEQCRDGRDKFSRFDRVRLQVWSIAKFLEQELVVLERSYGYLAALELEP